MGFFLSRCSAFYPGEPRREGLVFQTTEYPIPGGRSKKKCVDKRKNQE